MRPLRLAAAASALILLAFAGHWAWEEVQHRRMLHARTLPAFQRLEAPKPARPCPEGALTVIAFGQSNAANHGSERLAAPPGMADFHDGRCWAGDDPQHGGTETGGSPWPAFAQELGEPVIVATIAVGATTLEDWTGRLAPRLTGTVEALREAGHPPDALLFFQGEQDRATPGAAYREGLEKLAALTDVPLLLGEASVCYGEPEAAAQLTKARHATVAAHAHVHPGADTDALGAAYRWDGCHLNGAGLREAGRRWARALRAALGDGTIAQ